MNDNVTVQGDRTKNVGIIDSEYVVHQGIQTLGGQPPTIKVICIPFLLCFNVY